MEHKDSSPLCWNIGDDSDRSSGVKGISEQNRVVEIVYDPTPIHEGGFSPGARMSYLEMRETLKLGYFAEGTRMWVKSEDKVVRTCKTGTHMLWKI